MRKAVAVVGAVLGLGLAATFARAQSTASPRATYEPQPVAVADGGVLPVTLGGERLAAEVTGLEGGSVAVSGTVGLTPGSLASLVGPTCVPSDIVRYAATDTPSVVPVLSSTRTEVTIRNLSVGAKTLSCRPDISGTGDLPDCSVPGYGFTVSPAESVTFSYRASVVIRCRVCPSGSGVIEHLEVSCTG